MDGQFDKLEELIYVESHLSNTSAKFYGEITQQMLKNSSFPGSNNGTGLLQVRLSVCVWGGGCLRRAGYVDAWQGEGWERAVVSETGTHCVWEEPWWRWGCWVM
jgi:hypothetical protein